MKIPHTYFLFVYPHRYRCSRYLCHSRRGIRPGGRRSHWKNRGGSRNLYQSGHHAGIFFQTFKAIPQGMNEAAQIIFFVFTIAGAFGIIRATGTIDAGIASTVKKFRSQGILLIPVLTFIFFSGRVHSRHRGRSVSFLSHRHIPLPRHGL